MSHKTEIVKTAQTSDECIAITIRCCGNPKMESVLTVANVGKLTPAELAKKIDEHHDRTAAKCDAMQKASAHLATAMPKTKIHEVK
jgi:hypothetical protein